MNLSDKQKTFLKKLSGWFLRLAGWVLLLCMLLLAQSFVNQAQITLYGPASYVTRHCVFYTPELGDFGYTNPGGMMIQLVKLLLLIGGIVYAVACLTRFALNKAKLFQKISNKNKFLIAALIYSVAAIVFTATDCSSAYTASGKFYAKVRECQTIADYEKLCGKAVLHKTVDENDFEFIKAIAWFEKSGFQPGRELHIFKYRKPEVYLLVWSENGKIVYRDWCHQSAAVDILFPWGCDFFIDKTQECYIKNQYGNIVFHAQNAKSASGAMSAVEAEAARYLKCFKIPIKIKKRNDHFQCGNWQGIYLQISVPVRKTLLNTYILANDKQWLFLSGNENFTKTELAELLGRIKISTIYAHFHSGVKK